MSPAAPTGNDRSGGETSPEQVGGTARRIAVVPHTHWDREWYDPFQTFRLKLVRLVDGLLELMERDSSYSHFLLDGQVAVIDDYLEIRPENEERLRALTVAGRISVGPWYILMDEFLVSGETIVRNLQTGLRRAGAFGGAMNVGYLPDMFGHVAQMPQLLAAAGFEDAVVWRGVPSAVDRSAFRWRSPDGSSVRAEYLVAGYGNGAALPKDAKALMRRLRAQVEEFGSFLAAGDPVLLMNGSDHLLPQPWLGPVVAEANQIQDEFELAITSLPGYLEGATRDNMPEWRGELRSGWRSNVLMGVASNRVDVKQAASRAERALEQMAEPLSALFLPAEAWPAPFLDLAWKLVIRNSAHDSICACSADDVVDAVLHRYAEARHLGEGLAEDALAAVARSMAPAGPVVVNPSARDRGGMVEVVVPAVGEPGPGVQVLTERTGLPGKMTLDGETVRTMLGLIQGARIDDDSYITDVSLAEDETGLDVTIVIGSGARDGVPVEEVKRELYTKLTARPDTEVRVIIDQPSVRRILAGEDPSDGGLVDDHADLGVGSRRQLCVQLPLDLFDGHAVAGTTADHDGDVESGLVLGEGDVGDVAVVVDAGTLDESEHGSDRLAVERHLAGQSGPFGEHLDTGARFAHRRDHHLDHPATVACRGVDHDRTGRCHGPGHGGKGILGQTLAEVAGLGVAVQHGVDDVVGRAGTDGVVGRVADDQPPRQIEERGRPRLGRQEERRERLGHLLECPLCPAGRLFDVDPVGGDPC